MRFYKQLQSTYGRGGVQNCSENFHRLHLQERLVILHGPAAANAFLFLASLILTAVQIALALILSFIIILKLF